MRILTGLPPLNIVLTGPYVSTLHNNNIILLNVLNTLKWRNINVLNYDRCYVWRLDSSEREIWMMGYSLSCMYSMRCFYGNLASVFLSYYPFRICRKREKLSDTQILELCSDGKWSRVVKLAKINNMSQTNQLIFSHTTYSILQIHRWVKVESKRMGSSVAKTSENGYIVVKHNECRKTETR